MLKHIRVFLYGVVEGFSFAFLAASALVIFGTIAMNPMTWMNPEDLWQAKVDQYHARMEEKVQMETKYIKYREQMVKLGYDVPELP